VARFGSHHAHDAHGHDAHGHDAHHALPTGVLVPKDDIRNQPVQIDLSKPATNDYEKFCHRAVVNYPELSKLTKGQFLVAMRHLAWDERQTDKIIHRFWFIVFGSALLYIFTEPLERVEYEDRNEKKAKIEMIGRNEITASAALLKLFPQKKATDTL